MKFAVVEYISKSGKIWKHTPDKPNYLADPDKEIDPTSFGCYVSAFEGEHIPLKGLITGTALPVNPLVVVARRVLRKITGHWPKNYDFSYLTQFDVLMVVHQLSDSHELVTLLQRLQKKEARPYIIGVATQPYGILMDHVAKDSTAMENLKAHMDSCDVFIALTQSTVPSLQKLTDTPVVYVPQPYPVEYAAQFANSQKKSIIFVAGVTDRQNITLGFEVAAALQKKFPEYIIHFTQTPGYTQDSSALQNSRFEVQSFLPWQQQLEYLSSVKLVINTDYTATRGRVQVDCAAVGTPSIGADSDGQRDLFPDLYADENTTIEQLVAQGEKLLTDSVLYEKTVTIARQELQKYNYRESKKRLLELIQQHPK